MAEFDDIEYEGIGEDRHIVVGSERCFRDYSPGNTVISLSDDGQHLYLCPVPSFEEALQDDSKPHQESQSQVSYESTIEAGTDFPCALNRDALVALQQNAPYLGGEPLPLTRYQHDIQAYEQLALGIRADEYEPNPDPETSSLRPVAANGVPKDGQPSIGSAVSSLYLSPSPGRISSSGPFQSVAPEASLSSEQLHKLYGVVETSEWDDDMSPEERLEHFRRAYYETKAASPVRDETASVEVIQGSQAGSSSFA
ncbi:hypothetical protein GGS26DRAFT_191581 [Hypomontagnella submonticulosa]|nr:hypothetical protein GGS26DRAFT_191581 [Hypomontagnella submonticulosa]